jgi:hypothetical protein
MFGPKVAIYGSSPKTPPTAIPKAKKNKTYLPKDAVGESSPSLPDCIACALSCSCCFSSGRGKVAYLKLLKRTFQLKQNKRLMKSVQRVCEQLA